MTGLAQRLEGHFVSHDDAFLGENASLIGCLKREFLRRLDGRAGGGHSQALMLSLLQPIVMYLREQIMMAQSASCIVVDGYYYKILAKCLLLGLVDEEIFASWRRFPQPMFVIYLDADPETTWQRAGDRQLNPFEYYGSLSEPGRFPAFSARPGRRAFARSRKCPAVRVVRGDDRAPQRARMKSRSSSGNGMHE